MEEWK